MMIELPPDDFSRLLESICRLPINHLFARSVLERQVDGRAWVDRRRDPQLGHVINPYGMTLLFGGVDRSDAQHLKQHLLECRCSHDLWMQATPNALAGVLDDLLDAEVASATQAPTGPVVQRYTRMNFRFDPARYAARRAQPSLPHGATVRRMAADEFALPAISVSPHMFWRSADQFLSHGGGWCVVHAGAVVSMAFSSFRLDRQLEIGVETVAAYRGRGFALHAASALVDQCLAAGLEPIWSCRKENKGSCFLASALGFVSTLEIPYYRLPAAKIHP